jgi:hypothetical protein
MAATEKSEVVVDRGKWEWSELWKKEDWWAIWLGFIILIVGLIIFFPRPPAEMHEKLAKAEATMSAEEARAPFDTIEWHQANDTKSGLRARNEPYAQNPGNWTQRPGRWSASPMESLYLSEAAAAEIRAKAQPAYEAAQEVTKAALATAPKRLRRPPKQRRVSRQPGAQ